MHNSFVATEAGALPLPPLSRDNVGATGEGEPMWECIGLDPGGTTGWCVLRIHELAMVDPEYRILENVDGWSCGQINGSINHQIDRLVDLVECWTDAEIVCEDFVLRQMRGGRELLDPVRLTTPLSWWLERGGRRQWDVEEGEDWKPRTLHMQQPSLAMSMVTDERLKAWGLINMTNGQPHARDALRHALTFARRRKERNLKLTV